MGSYGSGRKPDPVKRLVQQQQPAGIPGDSFFIPNYSGVAHHVPTLRELDLRYVLSGAVGAGAWGTITGTLSDQTDLNNYLTSLSGAVVINTSTIDTVSGSVVTNTGNITSLSGAYYTHAGDSSIHFTSGALWNSIGNNTTNITTNTNNINSVSGGLVSLSGAYYTHAGDYTDPHTANLSQSGTISGAHMRVTADETTSGSAYVPNIIFNTTSGGITASNYTQGSLLVIYA